jgi:PKHD-type hydroxylase
MREPLFITGSLFNIDDIKKLNVDINKNLIKAKDKPDDGAIKSSQVKFVHLRSIQNLILPFLDFVFTANNNYFGFDLFQLTGSKILNYNTYNKDEEYTWHIDATKQSPIRDIKLTCLLNCSEINYEGGDLCLFDGKKIQIKDFKPGCAMVFPSFINHKVEKIISGSRATLAIWMNGPKFR